MFGNTYTGIRLEFLTDTKRINKHFYRLTMKQERPTKGVILNCQPNFRGRCGCLPFEKCGKMSRFIKAQ